MRASSLNVRLERKVYLPKYTTANSPHILRMYANMIFHIRVTQETPESTVQNDKRIPIDIIKVVSGTAHDRIIAYRDTSYEA